MSLAPEATVEDASSDEERLEIDQGVEPLLRDDTNKAHEGTTPSRTIVAAAAAAPKLAKSIRDKARLTGKADEMLTRALSLMASSSAVDKKSTPPSSRNKSRAPPATQKRDIESTSRVAKFKEVHASKSAPPARREDNEKRTKAAQTNTEENMIIQHAYRQRQKKKREQHTTTNSSSDAEEEEEADSDEEDDTSETTSGQEDDTTGPFESKDMFGLPLGGAEGFGWNLGGVGLAPDSTMNESTTRSHMSSRNHTDDASSVSSELNGVESLPPRRNKNAFQRKHTVQNVSAPTKKDRRKNDRLAEFTSASMDGPLSSTRRKNHSPSSRSNNHSGATQELGNAGYGEDEEIDDVEEEEEQEDDTEEGEQLKDASSKRRCSKCCSCGNITKWLILLFLLAIGCALIYYFAQWILWFICFTTSWSWLGGSRMLCFNQPAIGGPSYAFYTEQQQYDNSRFFVMGYDQSGAPVYGTTVSYSWYSPYYWLSMVGVVSNVKQVDAPAFHSPSSVTEQPQPTAQQNVEQTSQPAAVVPTPQPCVCPPPPPAVSRNENVAEYFRYLVKQFQSGKLGPISLKEAPNAMCFETLNTLKRFRQIIHNANLLLAYDTCDFNSLAAFEAKINQNVMPFSPELGQELFEMVRDSFED